MAQIILTGVSESTITALRSDSRTLGISPGEYVGLLIALRDRLETTPEPTLAELRAAFEPVNR